jgi:RHS repeat-associated protein
MRVSFIKSHCPQWCRRNRLYLFLQKTAATGFASSTTLNAAFNPSLSSTLTTTEYSTVAGTELGKPIRTKNYMGTYLESFMQYDGYGRLSNAFSNNLLYSPVGAITTTNFSEKVAMVYDLADNVLTKTRTHKPNSTLSRIIVETNDYDNGLRLKQMKHQLDAMPEQILSNMNYTLKNQVQTKFMGKTGALNYLQKVDYSYNALGWLTGINQSLVNNPLDRAMVGCFYPYNVPISTTDLDVNDLFSMDLKYESPIAALAPAGTTVIPQYSGNISQVVWKVRGREKQAYTLKYDSENRMTEAIYSDIGTTGTVTGNRYDEKLTYDIRGNINTLQRWGLTTSCTWGMIDNLSYNYGSYGYNIKNQLASVTESSDLTKGFKTVSNGSGYSYDNNGNMTSDPNKGITTIAYNHLNLPTTITFTNSRSISFLYDAGGNKLRKTVVLSGVTQYIQDYVGGIEYRTTPSVSSTPVLESIFHAEGRITPVGVIPTLKYEYALKDHLGNTRLMFSDKNGDGLISTSSAQETSEVTQENHYYPFGMAMESVWYNTPSVADNKYTYNGKEFNDDFGLNWNDYGARFYDASIGRFPTVDLLSEVYKFQTPYAYAANNPINMIDFMGMGPIDVDGGSLDDSARKNKSANRDGRKGITTKEGEDGGEDWIRKGDRFSYVEDKNLTLDQAKSKYGNDVNDVKAAGDTYTAEGGRTVQLGENGYWSYSDKYSDLDKGGNIIGVVGDANEISFGAAALMDESLKQEAIAVGIVKGFKGIGTLSAGIGFAVDLLQIRHNYKVNGYVGVGDVAKFVYDGFVVRYGGPIGGIIDGAWGLSGNKDSTFEGLNVLFSPATYQHIYQAVGNGIYEDELRRTNPSNDK